MTFKRELTRIARRIEAESNGELSHKQAWMLAAREMGALPVDELGPEEKSSLRASYTTESDEAARAAIGSGVGRLGLDECSSAQRRFRALLALGLYNGNVYSGERITWGCSVVASYDPVMSPRGNHLVIVAERAPENVAGWLLVADHDHMSGIPGLRFEGEYSRHGYQTIRMRHLPTGALVSVTGDRKARGGKPRREAVPWREYLSVDDGLRRHEEEALNAVPPLTEDAEVLLAGLTSRYTSEDRRRLWATNLSWDPLGRGEGRRQPYVDVFDDGPKRHLWGRGDAWVLKWSGYPYPRDLGTALTHREFRIKGAELERSGSSYRVILRSATLDLRDWQE